MSTQVTDAAPPQSSTNSVSVQAYVSKIPESVKLHIVTTQWSEISADITYPSEDVTVKEGEVFGSNPEPESYKSPFTANKFFKLVKIVNENTILVDRSLLYAGEGEKFPGINPYTVTSGKCFDTPSLDGGLTICITIVP